jgi:hypothetical protein
VDVLQGLQKLFWLGPARGCGHKGLFRITHNLRRADRMKTQIGGLLELGPWLASSGLERTHTRDDGLLRLLHCSTR